jgi:EPS-associated MarR family transcriptional regulator
LNDADMVFFPFGAISRGAGAFQVPCGNLLGCLNMGGRPTKLDENARFRVLRLLEKRPDVSQREIADEIGVSVGSVNYVLRALVDKGLVKLSRFRASEDKRRYSYILTPKGLAEKVALTKGFLVRMLEEYEALTAEIEELRGELHSPGPSGPGDPERGEGKLS